MPKVALRQWVLTVPFPWRSRLEFDGALLGAVARKFADAVLAFYPRRLAADDGVKGQSGAVLVVQRTSSDLRRNPHAHAVFLDGVFHECAKGEVVFQASPRLDTEESRVRARGCRAGASRATCGDPLSLLTRLCASVPPPRFHTVRYVGVLASASKLRPRILPEPPKEGPLEVESEEAEHRPRRCRYRPWAELMMRTFSLDVLCCPRCSGTTSTQASLGLRRSPHPRGTPSVLADSRGRARSPLLAWSSLAFFRRPRSRHNAAEVR